MKYRLVLISALQAMTIAASAAAQAPAAPDPVAPDPVAPDPAAPSAVAPDPARPAAATTSTPPAELQSAPPTPEQLPIRHTGPNMTLVIAGIAVTGIAVGAGIAFTALANGKANDARTITAAFKEEDISCERDATAGGCHEIQSAYRAKDRFSNMALWTFVGAGTVATATLIYVIVSSRKPERSSFLLSPVVSNTDKGVFMAWMF